VDKISKLAYVYLLGGFLEDIDEITLPRSMMA
jgi:recombinational DNA repair protein RecR